MVPCFGCMDIIARAHAVPSFHFPLTFHFPPGMAVCSGVRKSSINHSLLSSMLTVLESAGTSTSSSSMISSPKHRPLHLRDLRRVHVPCSLIVKTSDDGDESHDGESRELVRIHGRCVCQWPHACGWHIRRRKARASGSRETERLERFVSPHPHNANVIHPSLVEQIRSCTCSEAPVPARRTRRTAESSRGGRLCPG